MEVGMGKNDNGKTSAIQFSTIKKKLTNTVHHCSVSSGSSVVEP
jgi:hypothetical protein